MSVIYQSQIGRFHTESYPKWPRHEPDWFYGVFSNIVGGRQLADSLPILQFLSVSCQFGRYDWGITIVCSNVYSGADQSKHQSSPSLAFVRGIHRGTGEFPAHRASNTENVSIWWSHHAFVDAVEVMVLLLSKDFTWENVSTDYSKSYFSMINSNHYQDINLGLLSLCMTSLGQTSKGPSVNLYL